MKNNITMPKNKKQLEQMLIKAFMAGCTHGYAVEHTKDIYEQELLGAKLYVGCITQSEYLKRWEKLND